MEQRFLNKVEKTETCWNWTSRLFDRSGYGQFNIKSAPVLAHRHAYTTWKGEIPTGLLVRHTCDNRKCVNPEHLIVGTHQDNSNDAVERNRQAKGEALAQAQYQNRPRGKAHGSKTKPEALMRGDEWRRQHAQHTASLRGTNNHWAKLTEDDVREIRVLCGFDFPHRELAKIYGVSRPVMSKVIRGESYKNVS
jgi:hypothetical protein